MISWQADNPFDKRYAGIFRVTENDNISAPGVTDIIYLGIDHGKTDTIVIFVDQNEVAD